jgi:uncharacterized Zn finger protein
LEGAGGLTVFTGLEGIGMGYFGYAPYVSVAERRAKAQKAAAKALKGGAKLSPIAPYRGAIAKTFWGKAWCDNLEQYSDYANRLPRGRTYVRNGSVIDLQMVGGDVQARVMGSSLYTVKVTVAAVAIPHWKAIGADCAGSIDSMVELLQGKLTKPVMERICKPQTGLFPAPKDIRFSCSCPDSASMCKHIAAVLYGVGARLDQQPQMLFMLRQVDAKDLVSQAGQGLPTGKQGSASSKVLDDAQLADVFGLDMDEEPTPAPAAKALRAKAAGSKKSAIKPAETAPVKPKKAAAKTPRADNTVKAAKTDKAAAKPKAAKKVVKKPVAVAKKTTKTKLVAATPASTASVKRPGPKTVVVAMPSAKKPAKPKALRSSLTAVLEKGEGKQIRKRLAVKVAKK